MGNVSVTKIQPLREVFDLRLGRGPRDNAFQTLIDTGNLLENNSEHQCADIALARHFIETGRPCVSTSYSAYLPLGCRVYPNNRDRLPFHVVASISKWELHKLEIVAYPRVEDLEAFQLASCKTTTSFGPGDDHPGSLGVLAFSLEQDKAQVEYLQSSVNYRSNLLGHIVDPKLARKYAGWQAEVIRTMTEMSETMGVRSVIVKAGSRVSESIRNLLHTAFAR